MQARKLQIIQTPFRSRPEPLPTFPVRRIAPLPSTHNVERIERVVLDKRGRKVLQYATVITP